MYERDPKCELLPVLLRNGLCLLRSSEEKKTHLSRMRARRCSPFQACLAAINRIVGILLNGALSPASQSSHSLIAVRFAAVQCIGCSFRLVVLFGQVVVVFFSINVLVVLIVIVSTPCGGVVVVASVVD